MKKLTNIEKLMSEDENPLKNTSDEILKALEKKLEYIDDTYIYIKTQARYLWIEEQIFFTPSDTANNLLLEASELKLMRQFWLIKSFNSLTYKKWGKNACYNLLDEDEILKPSETPTLHSLIWELISNVCWNKKENIDYLHKAILYKYSNINDFTIPAIVFYWKGWSGKGTLMSLLWTIFSESNVLANLWQRDLTGSFDTYTGKKIIVEFAEVTTNNTNNDKSILNKLKNIIWAEKLTINEKNVKQYQIENIAWFFISSNSNKPLQLDDKDKWNRRFTIIRSDSSLKNWENINKIVRDKESVRNYLSWLYKNFSEVLEYKKLEALDNQDKKDLEERWQSEANQFWEWLETDHPNYTGKKKKTEIEDMINIFCIDNNIDEQGFLRFFWNNSKYPKKKIRLWERTYMGVIIPNKS